MYDIGISRTKRIACENIRFSSLSAAGDMFSQPTKRIVCNRGVGVIEVGIVRSLISGPRKLSVRLRSVGIVELRILLRVAFLEQRTVRNRDWEVRIVEVDII